MGRRRPKPAAFHFIPFRSAGLPGRVKRNPDNALLSGLRFTGCNWKPCWFVLQETLCEFGIRTGKRICVWKDPAVETANVNKHPSAEGARARCCTPLLREYLLRPLKSDVDVAADILLANHVIHASVLNYLHDLGIYTRQNHLNAHLRTHLAHVLQVVYTG